MVDLNRAYVNQAILFSQHVMDDRVRFRQEEAEKAFGSILNGQSQQTNVPDDMDPNAPRLIFSSSNKQLLLSKTAIQALFGFEGPDKSLEDQLAIIVNNFEKISSRIPLFQKLTGEFGFVLTLNVPSSDSQGAMSSSVYERFLKLDKLHDVARASFKVGFKTDSGFFINFEVGVYQQKKFDIKPGVMGQVVNLDDLPTYESGYSFNIDINNKPRLGSFKEYALEKKDVIECMLGFVKDELPRLAHF